MHTSPCCIPYREHYHMYDANAMDMSQKAMSRSTKHLFYLDRFD